MIDLKCNLKQALSNSINPLKDIEVLIDELNTELLTIDRQLGENSSTSKITDDLLKQINNNDDFNNLNGLQSLINLIKDGQILNPNEIIMLDNSYAKMVDRLLSSHLPTLDVIENSPTLNFIHAVRSTKTIIILDGHNILHRVKYLFEKTYNNKGYPGEKSITYLIELLKAYLKNQPECNVRLYLDSPYFSSEKYGDQLTVTYSGGEGDHKADKEIMRYVETIDSDLYQNKVVISADNEITDFAKECNAKVLSPMEFSLFIN